MSNFVGVDRGALTMACNVLGRAGKHEVKNELWNGSVKQEEFLQHIAKDNPELYMRFVTENMLIIYT